MTPPLQIRPYAPQDAEAVRRIACDTALYGQPVDRVCADRTLVADFLVGYYLAREPADVFVAEAEGRVVGYLTGCVDTRAYERAITPYLAPRVLRRCLGQGHWHRGAFWRLAGATCGSVASWAGVRRAVVEQYPAHCHLNLDAGFRHAGTGSALLEAFLGRLHRRQVRGIHIVTATEPGKEFFTKTGFTVLARYPAPALPGLPPREAWVMGKPLDISVNVK